MQGKEAKARIKINNLYEQKIKAEIEKAWEK
jgi:hypothetical protein